jgi:desulfoferrodoxin (superoxide reductase-like protein)
MDMPFLSLKKHSTGPHRLLGSLLRRAVESTKLMIETGIPHPAVPSHPQILNDTEIAALREVLLKLVEAVDTFEENSALLDMPVAEVCTSESMVRVLARSNIHSVLDLWQRGRADLLGVYELARPMGGRNQLQMYLFVNE